MKAKYTKRVFTVLDSAGELKTVEYESIVASASLVGAVTPGDKKLNDITEDRAKADADILYGPGCITQGCQDFTTEIEVVSPKE